MIDSFNDLEIHKLESKIPSKGLI